MIFSHDDETIIAQCTPRGSGALAIIRLSGINAINIASTISKLASAQPLNTVDSHTIHFGYIIDEQKKPIDHVMFAVMYGPKTFTGQDTVEITCHNNPFIIQEIIATAISCGARLAKEGEFTKRAVLNGKIDLTQAEAINELIHANTQMVLKKSLAQLEGTFSSWISGVEKNLIKALAFSEASFEFIDEEISFGNQIKDLIGSTLHTISSIKKTFDQHIQIRQGIRIAIIGSVNAGKSSLFNALLNKDRAIVTSIAGTTRDAIEGGVYKNDTYWTLIDTAGLRQTEDIIEQEGIHRAYKEAQQADIILLVFDGARHLTDKESIVYEALLEKYPAKIIVVHNKADLPTIDNRLLEMQSHVLKVSSRDKTNITLIEQAIESKIKSLLEKIESPFLLNQRQFNLLLGLENKLQLIQSTLNSSPIAYELLSFHLNDALAHLSELTGKSISEQGMDAVFKEFCVGK
jgi:tRNA modification GTPase